MSLKWKATLPKEKPPVNKVHCLVAIKSGTGYRGELSMPNLPHSKALLLWTLAHESPEECAKFAKLAYPNNEKLQMEKEPDVQL